MKKPVNTTPTRTEIAPLDNVALAREIALTLGWRIEPATETKRRAMPAIIDDGYIPPDVRSGASNRNFERWAIFTPAGERLAVVAEHEIVLFLPEWTGKTDVALTLPLEAERWQLNMSAGVPIAYIIDAGGAEVGSGSATHTARALCLAWLNYRSGSHAV